MQISGGITLRTAYSRIARPLSRQLRSLSSVPVSESSFDTLDIQQFRDVAFAPARTLLMRGQNSQGLPAIRKWFQMQDDISYLHSEEFGFTDYLESFKGMCFPYELIYPQWSKDLACESVSQFSSWLSKSEDEEYRLIAEMFRDIFPPEPSKTAGNSQLFRFEAPLTLLISALEYNRQQRASSNRVLTQLYIAQASLNDLPLELRDDVTIPNIVNSAGKGDVYDSSVWLGLEPTYTPWHRDPNPNLFCQLCSSKVIRLLPPNLGEHIFRTVQMKLGRHGSSRIRGEEMMHGPERTLLHDAIWSPDANPEIFEARVSPGDALFIPKGWWHSVRSVHGDGRLNGSVNWWFR